MKIRLNLATRPLETHRRFLFGAGVAGAVAGILFLSLSWHVYQVRKANQEYRAKRDRLLNEMTQLRRERQELEQFFSRPENARLHDRANFLNSLIDQRSFNWTRMFMDLEKVLPPGVRVASISPKLENGSVEVKLVVGAASDDAKLEFLRALETSKEFSRVRVLAERVPPGGGSADRVLVELTAFYLRT